MALNLKARGGTGDVARTLPVCRMLAEDGDDMVVKALSWALRAVVPYGREAVEDFLAEYDHRLGRAGETRGGNEAPNRTEESTARGHRLT